MTFDPADVIEWPTCPTCSARIEHADYDAEFRETYDVTPLWPGGPLVAASFYPTGHEIVSATYTARPCGHEVPRAVLTWITAGPPPPA